MDDIGKDIFSGPLRSSLPGGMDKLVCPWMRGKTCVRAGNRQKNLDKKNKVEYNSNLYLRVI